MLVLYFLQGELGESMDRPNAFVAPGTSLTFGQFLQHFPLLDQTALHFRFRAEDPNFGYVWEDVKDKSYPLPTYNGSVFAKILRTDVAAAAKRKILLKRKNLEASNPLVQQIQSQFNNATKQQSAPAISPVNRQSAQASASEAERSPPPPKPSKPLPKVPPHAVNTPATTSFFDTDEAPSSSKNTTAPSLHTPQPDILDFGEPSYAPSSAKFAAGTSSKGSRSPIPTTAAMDIDDDHRPAANMATELNREDLAARKEEAIEDKVKNALDFKKEMDFKKEKEMQDFDSAREKHERAILAWSTNNKEKRNIRSLLSTMHTVLPPDTKWKALGLGDVLESGQVKKAYRKAMLVVHPDHCINADSETKFICKRVFEAINEAYDEFTKKESV